MFRQVILLSCLLALVASVPLVLEETTTETRPTETPPTDETTTEMINQNQTKLLSTNDFPTNQEDECQTDDQCGKGKCKSKDNQQGGETKYCDCHREYATYDKSKPCDYHRKSENLVYVFMSFIVPGWCGIHWFYLSNGTGAYIFIGILQLALILTGFASLMKIKSPCYTTICEFMGFVGFLMYLFTFLVIIPGGLKDGYGIGMVDAWP